VVGVAAVTAMISKPPVAHTDWQILESLRLVSNDG